MYKCRVDEFQSGKPWHGTKRTMFDWYLGVTAYDLATGQTLQIEATIKTQPGKNTYWPGTTFYAQQVGELANGTWKLERAQTPDGQPAGVATPKPPEIPDPFQTAPPMTQAQNAPQGASMGVSGTPAFETGRAMTAQLLEAAAEEVVKICGAAGWLEASPDAKLAATHAIASGWKIAIEHGNLAPPATPPGYTPPAEGGGEVPNDEPGGPDSIPF